MSLNKLLGASLGAMTPSKVTIRKLTTAAARHIADARVEAVSPETRFSSAYTAIRMLADVGLHAHGYRTLTSRPGHHYTAIQTLSLTFDISEQTVARLDQMRKQRNVTEYSGDIVTDAEVSECISQAESLYSVALAWLKKNKVELLE